MENPRSIYRLSTAREVAHQVGVWVESLETFGDATELLPILIVRELLPSDTSMGDTVSEAPNTPEVVLTAWRERIARKVQNKWRWHHERRLAIVAINEALASLSRMLQVSGLPNDDETVRRVFARGTEFGVDDLAHALVDQLHQLTRTTSLR